MQDRLVKVDQYERENPFTGWNLKINLKFHETLFIPKVNTLCKIGVAQKVIFLPRRKY